MKTGLGSMEETAFIYRGVAQLAAHLFWEQDVGGSSPSTPTINYGTIV